MSSSIADTRKSDFTLRAMNADDSDALVDLARACPDTGQISYVTHYQAAPYAVFRSQSKSMDGFVAVADSGAIIGCQLVYYADRRQNGQRRPCGFVNTLMVHPDWRRKGVAAALVCESATVARRTIGDQGFFACFVQRGNRGSLNTVSHIGLRPIRDFVSAVTSTSHRKPESRRSPYTIRLADKNDLEQVAAGMNDFYSDHDMYSRSSAADLDAWLQATPCEQPIHQYLVAVDAHDRICAGLGVLLRGRIIELHFSHLPWTIALANRILGLLPGSGVAREVVVEKMWYRPGALAAARQLWRHARWQWHEEADLVRIHMDPRGPLPGATQIAPWMPRAHFHVCVDEARPNGQNLNYVF